MFNIWKKFLAYILTISIKQGRNLTIKPRKHSRPGWTGLWATWPSGRCPCSLQGGWAGWPFKGPSDPNHSMILWKC